MLHHIECNATRAGINRFSDWLLLKYIHRVVTIHFTLCYIKETSLLQHELVLHACSSHLPHTDVVVASIMNPELSSRSSIKFWHISYCCTKVQIESLGVINVLKYEFRPSDLPVVLVNGKKLFLKYTGAHVVFDFHMFCRCLFS